MSGRPAAAPATAPASAPAPAGARRDAAGSRERLLRAAQALFAERGYERTTIRGIGQRAQVDPALIARYFGSKAALYLASIRLEEPATGGLELTDPAVVEHLLNRAAAQSETPILHAAVRPHRDPELQGETLGALDRRLIEPSRARAAASGAGTDAQLRAELATAALAGVVLSRTSGAMPTLSAASSSDVARLLADLVERVLQPRDA